MGAFGVILALIEREKTGKGKVVNIDMVGTCFSSVRAVPTSILGFWCALHIHLPAPRFLGFIRLDVRKTKRTECPRRWRSLLQHLHLQGRSMDDSRLSGTPVLHHLPN